MKDPASSNGASEMLNRQPPCNLEAEMCVLGSILIMPTVCDDVALTLRTEDFYDEANASIYKAMLEMHETGRKIDPTLLVEQLRSAGTLDEIGGIPYLAKVGNIVPNAAHAIYYAQIVREKATYRSLIHASTDILKNAYDETQEAREALSMAEQRIFSILDRRGESNVSELSNVLHDALDRIDLRMKGSRSFSGVETGFYDLDQVLGGLQKSALVVLAARPAMGKTALAMNIAEYVAIEVQEPVLFISLEMGAMELIDRLLCSRTQVNGHRLRNGTISQEEQERLVAEASQISDAPLFVDDSPTRTVTEVAAAARRIRRRHKKLSLIVIDYLQLIEPDDSKIPRQEQVSRMTRRLKGLARELEVPILCLAQLNRQSEATNDNIPKLSHLRESGAIEQDADVVMFVHREEYYHRGEEAKQYEGQAKIIIAKQRSGPIGDVELRWEKDHTRFLNASNRNYDDFEQFNEGSDGGGDTGFANHSDDEF
ncbi:MAG: replicative DNA helicase [Pirellulaceae bacterium]|nr:replicative DNA helicase [Pirellulaceae bacterium]